MCGRNRSPPQSIGGSGLASISTESSVSDSIVVVIAVVVVVVDVVVDGGVYVGLGDVVDSYVGRSATVVDSTPVWSTSMMIASVPKSEEMAMKRNLT